MHKNSATERRGFTMLELLLTLSVISVLLALIIPSVLAMRESSRRLHCQSSLRQLGHAIHGYVSAHGSLPPVAPAQRRERRKSADNTSALTMLLPWLDQNALAEKLQKYRPLTLTKCEMCVTDHGLCRLVITPIELLRCPSDQNKGLNNYVFCLGADAVATVDPRSQFWGLGPFPLTGSLPLSDVRDGTSNTAAVSERLTGSENDTEFDERRDFWLSGVEDLFDGRGAWPVGNSDLTSICDAARPQSGRFRSNFGWSWAFGRYDTTCYNHVVTPNSSHVSCSTRSVSEVFRGANHGVFRATSMHPGGVNQLLLDGSVRFISNDVSQNVYRALGTRDGAELLNSNEF